MTIPLLASIDGEITPSDQATLSLPDDGLYRGDGVFEVIRIYGGQPFALAAHLDRLERSAAAIELPVARAALEAELAPLVERAGDNDGQLRIVLTRGGRRILLSELLPEWNETLTLATVSYQPTIILTGVKSISYAANMQATRIAKRQGADEALLVRPDGVVLEAPTSSLFWVDDANRLVTPHLDAGILDSITRARVIDELGVEQGEYKIEEVLRAREAFLASTTREVQGVSQIDGIGFEAPGPRTREAEAAFAAAVERDLGKP